MLVRDTSPTRCGIGKRGPKAVFFRQVLYRDLGCASYMVGDHGQAVVVDPRWDIGVYLEIADAEGLRITHVLDSHDHADHVSGRERLAEATGASIHRPLEESGQELTLRVGAVQVRAIAAPGHRPEHRVFTVADLSRSPEPWLLLTGDSLLVGDIARPDLAYEPAEGARALHATLGGLVGLGEHVEVWPGHVGGSLCGGANLSAKPSSTIGFERRHNPLLGLDATRFIGELTGSLPTRPPNVDRIVELNRRPSASAAVTLRALGEAEVGGLLTRGITVLDGRPPQDFDLAHLAGSVNLPVASAGVGTRAGWTLSPDDELLLVAEDERSAMRMAAALQAVGFSALAGYNVADEFTWAEAELPVARSDAWDLDRLAAELRAATVDLIDVREPHEWALGHVTGSMNLPLHRLSEVAAQDLPNEGRTTAVACAAGARAAFAASMLRRSGRPDVVRISDGGVPDLSTRGLDLEVGL
jgi:glyoxylase-like metal-dependent hydrolase (beta-lactamase superfamily II)/rhodanese-related sulfurtransferase